MEQSYWIPLKRHMAKTMAKSWGKEKTPNIINEFWKKNNKTMITSKGQDNTFSKQIKTPPAPQAGLLVVPNSTTRWGCCHTNSVSGSHAEISSANSHSEHYRGKETWKLLMKMTKINPFIPQWSEPQSPVHQQHRCRVQSSRQLQNNSPAEAQRH